MGRQPDFHPEAAAEAAAARAWYHEQSPKAAAAFLAELDAAIGHIAENPGRYPAYIDGTRRYLMHRFPFLVVYRVDVGAERQTQVVAVAHGNRRPGYWQGRSR